MSMCMYAYVYRASKSHLIGCYALQRVMVPLSRIKEGERLVPDLVFNLPIETLHEL